jgi:hypothetical protein
MAGTGRLLFAMIVFAFMVTVGVAAGMTRAAHAVVGPRSDPAVASALADIGPRLGASPASLVLGVGESASVALILDAGSAALDNMSLDLYQNGSFTTALIRPFGHHLGASATALAIIKVSANEPDLIRGSLTAVLSARRGGVNTVLTVSVPITERSLVLSPLATLSIPAAPTSIDDRHPGTVVARITNPTTVPIMVSDVRPISTDSISVTAVSPMRPFMLTPGGSQDLVFTARTAPGFVEGSHVVSIEARVSLMNGGRSQVLVADRTITVSVFGAAQITSAVGAVSFLVVPGLLILVVAKLLWEQVAPRRPLPWLAATQAEYWAGAITLSIITIPIYYGLTAPFGAGRNLITSFNSDDILRLWVGALAAGVIAWLGCFMLWSRGRIKPGNSELTVLKKLSRRRYASLKMQLAGIEGQSGTYGLDYRVGDEVVLVPRIVYDSNTLKVLADLDEAVNHDRVRRFLNKARSGSVKLQFEDNRAIEQIATARVKEKDILGRIVIAKPPI